MDFEFSTPPGWSERVAEFRQRWIDVDGDVVVAVGKCPRCLHQMEVVLTAEDPPYTKVAGCDCLMPHEGRPEEVKRGCGAHGTLKVIGRPGDKEWPVDVTGLPALGSRYEVSWETLAAESEAASLDRVKAVADKWLTAIGTLTGVLGIVTLIKGPEDIADVTGTVEPGSRASDWLVAAGVGIALFALLGGILALKRKSGKIDAAIWAAVLVGAIGFIVLARVHLSWEVWIGIFLAVAVGFAAVAIRQAAIAAQARAPLKITSGADLRRRTLKAATIAEDQLRWSRLLALASVPFLAAAIGATWFHTPEEPKTGPKVVVVSERGAAACGELRADSAGIVFVKEKSTRRLPLGNYRTFSPIAACPG